MTAPTLTEFLLARIAEDEAEARCAAAGYGARWSLREVGREMVDDETGSEVVTYGGVRNLSDADHIARHDPARVLAECEAKRRIVELHPTREGYCDGCGIEVQHPDGCHNLRALAAVYADHPDYRAEWKP